MDIISIEDIKKHKEAGTPEDISFSINKGTMYCLGKFYKHFIASRPIRFAIQGLFLLFCIAMGIIFQHWSPLFIFLIATLVMHTLIVIVYFRLFHLLNNGSVLYGIDKYGISIFGMRYDDVPVRTLTDSWALVRKIAIYTDLIVIKMDKKAEGANEYFLFTDDVATARRSILTYWHRAVNGSTGKTVDFIHLIPCTSAEAEYYHTHEDYYDRIKHILNIDLLTLDDNEDTNNPNNVVAQHIINHFNSVVNSSTHSKDIPIT